MENSKLDYLFFLILQTISELIIISAAAATGLAVASERGMQNFEWVLAIVIIFTGVFLKDYSKNLKK